MSVNKSLIINIITKQSAKIGFYKATEHVWFVLETQWRCYENKLILTGSDTIREIII